MSSLLRRFVPGLVLVASSCADSETMIRHPLPDGLVRPIPASANLSMQAGNARPTTRASSPGSLLREIGVFDQPIEHVFGKIGGVVTDRFNRLHVLDVQARIVRVFDDNGGFAFHVGGPGSGPGHFMHPRALVADREHRLFVLDGNGLIHVFEIQQDSALFATAYRFPGDAFSGCVLDDRLFVHGTRIGKAGTIHAYSAEGDLEYSFGALYETTNRIVRNQLSRGRIVCLEEAGVILLAPDLLPEVRAYSPAGALVWWLEIDDFAGLPVWETRRGSAALLPQEHGYDIAVALVGAPAHSGAVLQIARSPGHRRTLAPRDVALYTFFIAAESQTGRYLGDTWPRLAHWDEHRIVALLDQPYPKLLIHVVE